MKIKPLPPRLPWGAQTTASNSIANMANSPIIFYASGPDSQNNYTLDWNVMISQLTTASYVTIIGGGNVGPATQQQPVYGSMTVNSAAAGTKYVLTVFDPTGKVLGTASVTLSPSSQQSYNYNPNAPAVAGAYTTKPAIQTRGPFPQLSIR